MDKSGYWLKVAGTLAAIVFLCVLSRQNYLLFHGIIETFSAVVPGCIFILTLTMADTSLSALFIVVGCGQGAVALFTLLHMLAYKGMNAFDGGTTANLATQLWIATRLLDTGALFAGVWLIGRKVKIKQVILVFAAAAGGLFAGIFIWPVFPDCFIEGQGLTPFKIAAEYAMIICLAWCVWQIWSCRKQFSVAVMRRLVAAYLLHIAAGLSFTAYSDVYGAFNMLGHLMIFASYLLFADVLVLHMVREVWFHELSESEAQFRSIAESSPDSILRFDPDCRCIYASPSALQAFGLTEAGSIVGRTLQEAAFPKPQGEYLEGKMREAFRTAESQKGEFVWNQDEVPRVFELVISPVQTPDSRIASVMSISRDITDRKKAEEELLRFRTVADFTYDWVYWLLPDGKRAYVSPSCERITGYRAEEWMQDSGLLEKITHPDDRDILRNHAQEMKMSESLEHHEICFRILTRDGQERWIGHVCQAAYDSHGNYMGRLVSHRDITKRKLAETALASSVTQLRTLVETIPDLIWLKNPEGFYLSCNKMFENFFGAKEADIVGKTDYDFVDKALADFFRDNDRKAMAAGKPSVNEEWLTFASDGHKALVETIKMPMVDDGGTMIGVLGISRDITERDLTEKTAKRVAEVQTVLREIAEFAVISNTLEELYGKVHQAVGRVLPAEIFLVNLLDEAAQEIVVPYNSQKADFILTRRPLAQGMTEYIMRLGRAALFSSSDMERLRESGEYTLEQVQKIKMQQCLGAPLIDSQGTAFGMIVSILLDDTQTFHSEDVDIFSVIAAQVSLAIERKRAEEALREAAERNKMLVEQAQDGIVLVSPEGRFLSSNNAFLTMMGHSLEELTQLYVLDTVAPSEQSVVPEHMRKIAAGTGMLKEWNLVRKNGSILPAEISAQVLSDGRHITIIRDITERRQREQELRSDAQLATRVQKALLSLPAKSEFLEVVTIFQPFDYVGGDLYFMDWRYDGSLLRGFLLEAPGHGLSTALHTASLHVLLREVNERDLPLADAMHWLNRRAGEYFDGETFVGAIGFEIDLETRELRSVCGGISKIWLATKSEQGIQEYSGRCLGLQGDARFATHVLPLEIGDSFYFVTEGLAGLLEQQVNAPLKRYPEMTDLLRTLSETQDRRDDATAVCIHVRSLPRSMVRQDGWPRILRVNGYGDYQRFKGEIARILSEVTGKPHSLQEVAVHEALANAMECRDGVPRQHKARLRFNKVGNCFIVRVKTSRMGFAGNAVLRRLRSQPEDMFSFGEDASMGRGIPMMLSMSHKMTYNSEGTEVLLAWRL